MSFDKARTAAFLLSAACVAGSAGLAVAAPVTRPADPAAQARLSEAYNRLPLSFEANRGQADPRVQFLSRGSGYTLFLASTDAVLALRGPGAIGTRAEFPDHETAVLRMKVLGASASARPAGIAELPGRSNYLVGNDPAAWRAGIPSYAAVRYEGVYPGVDLVYHGSNQRELEYDFVVGPGADPRQIRLGFEGADRLRLDAAGNLVLKAGGRAVTWRAPVAYQETRGTRRPVGARYEITGRREVAFRVAAYDLTKPLVIDPVLAYSTYLGGTGGERGVAIAVDGAGSAYVTGTTGSANFPTRDPLQATLAAGDAFVTKLSPDGSSLVYSTYLGGAASSDTGLGIALDASGSAYVTGQTCAADFPTVNAAQGVYAGGCDAFVAKLSPTGGALAYSTFLGGTAQDMAQGVAVDAAGSAYVTGLTFAANFPTVNALQATIGSTSSTDAFVAKLSPAGNALEYSTYLGGASLDTGTGIAVDAAGSAYVVGSTQSLNFPTANAFQGTRAGFSDAYLAKLSPAGVTLAFSTYLGGNCSTGGWGVAVDASGSAYVTGTTCASNFPVANAFQATKPGSGADGDIFVTRFSPAGTALVYSTYLGGTGGEIGRAVAVDAAGSAYVTGWTFSTDFPTVNAVQGSNAGPYDVVVSKVSPTGSSLLYSTYLGGSDDDFRQTGGNGIAVDASGNAYVAATTISNNFPTANPFQATRAGSSDVVVFRLTADPPPAVDPVASAGADQTAAEGTIVTLDGSASTDPDGDPLTYLWEQVAGPTVTLSDATSAQPSFTAPSVPVGGATLTFRLVVSDGVHDSQPETVDVTITNVNQAPDADAGDDQTVQEGSSVTLHAGDSFDPDGEALTYEWTQTAGTAVTLSDPTAASPDFTAPPVGSAGETLSFTVIVSDGVAQSTDEVAIVVTNVNQVPAADAGLDQTVDEGAAVTLQGTASGDPDGDALTYSWTQVGGPAVALSDPTSAVPAFTAPEVGPGGATLVFQLVVSDGSASATDLVTITVRDGNQPPSCDLARASLGVLWPPAHRLVPIGIVGVADAEDPDVTITITAVTQDEPVNGLGDGDTSPDAVTQGASVLLRAERSGAGTGRLYTVFFTAQDTSGATCAGSVTVCVPHARRTGACVDEGQAHDSRQP
jgi:hypothetical protein